MVDDRLIFSPVQVKFDGRDATKHHLDAEQLGKSIQGTAKLYNAASYVFFNGKAPNKRTKYTLRMQTRAEFKEGSLCYSIWSAMVVGEMALYPKLWGELADLVVPDILKAAYLKMIRREDKVKETRDKMLEVLQQELQKDRHAQQELNLLAFNTILKSQDQFLEVITKLADNSRGAARDSVEPIGRTADYSEHSTNNQPLFLIDEPMADAIRSRENLEVTEPTTYTAKIVEVDKTKKGCKVLIEGIDKPVSCKVSDPIIQNKGNVYTHALDQETTLTIHAKATLQNNEIKMLYISHAEE